MNDPAEDRLRSGFAQLVREKPYLGPIDLAAVRDRRPRRPASRWLLVAAALVLIVGFGIVAAVGALQGQRGIVANPGQPSPSLPPSPSASTTRAGDSPLIGTRWLLTHLLGQPAIPGHAGRAPYLILERGDRLRGSDSCNDLQGSYRLDGAEVEFTDVLSRLMACGEKEQMQQQSAFVRLLDSVASLRLDGSVLTLRNAGGTDVLTFKAADRPSPAPATGVLIRIRNDASIDFDDVRTTPSGGSLDYGPLAAGQTSAYREDPKAYSYSYVRVRLVDGRILTQQPKDFLGETPLPPGRYTYVLTVDETGKEPRLGQRPEADQ